jgi:hypothetical protein
LCFCSIYASFSGLKFVNTFSINIFLEGEMNMARKYSESASKDVERAMHKMKKGTLKSGRSGKTVRSRDQAIAIGLSEAREKGKKVPEAPSKRSS